MADWVEQLELICEKNPIVRTYKSPEIIESPATAERTYIRHAETHMSLGDTSAHLNRMINALEKNKRVFVGGVSGEYGLGKTSLAAFLWRQLEREAVVAVPPFCWSSFDEIFSTVHAWVRYKLRTNPDAQTELDRVYEQYSASTREKEIELLVRDGMSRDRAEAHVDRLIRQGTVFERRVPDLFSMLSRFTALVQRNGYRGIVVFTDELQEAVQHLGAGTVFSYLFSIADTAQEYEGAFGFFFSIPANTRQQILDTRSDVMDRLVNQRLFVDLATVYSSSFAKDLWLRYAEFFNFYRDRFRIVAEDALDALGQLTDSSRRDLGNGPRTVISAFRAIAQHWKRRRTTFTARELAEACLSREIMLGENSQWLSKTERLIGELGSDNVDLVKLIAVFPQGCTDQVLRKHGFDKERDKKFLRSALGEHIREVSGRGYVFLALEGRQVSREMHYERALRTFSVEYVPGRALAGAVYAMGSLLEQSVFGSNHWSFIQENGGNWTEGNLTLFGNMQGAFPDWNGQFPNRRVAVTVTANPQRPLMPASERDHETSVFTAHLVFVLVPGQETSSIRIADGTKHTYIFALGLDRRLERDTILNRYMESSSITVQTGLSLLRYFDEQEGIPEGEWPELRTALVELMGEVVAACFSKDLHQVQGGSFSLRTSGAQVVRELLQKVCNLRFPEYRTLIVSRDWKSKMQRYAGVLDREQLDVLAKRGQEELLPNVQVSELKKRVAELFGYTTVGPFESYCAELKELMEADWKKGSFRLKSHPGERAVMAWLAECADRDRIMVEGAMCEAVNSRDVFDRFRTLGYTMEELRYLLQFGRQRRYFNLQDNMIYRKPVTVSEYKAELTEMVEDLKSRVDLLEQVKEKQLPLDPRELADAVAALERLSSEEEFQRLKATLFALRDRIVERMRSRAEGDRQRMDQQLRRLFDIAKATKESAKRLKQPIGSSVPWATDLNDLRIKHAATWDECGELYAELKRDADHLRAQPQPWKEEGLGAFVEFVCECNAIAKESTEATRSLEAWELKARNLARWEDLAASAPHTMEVIEGLGPAVSDEWHAKLADAHQYAAKALNEGAEAAHSKDQYSNLMSQAKAHAERFKLQFEHERLEWTTLLNDLSIKASLFAGWSESEPDAAYRRLRQEAVSWIQNELEKSREQLAGLSVDLRYAQSVLGVQPERTAPLSDAIETAEGQLQKLKALLLGPVTPQLFGSVKEQFHRIRSLYTQIAGQNRLLTKPTQVSPAAQALLQQIGRQESLRNIILAYAARKSTMDLDEVLNLVLELFRNNQVDISVTARGQQ